MDVIRDRALAIMATATLLALVYFARDVLVPITLAFILSLLVAPWVRGMRRLGLNQTFSVLAAVLLLAAAVALIATVIGSQVVRIAASLPQYETTIRQKLETLDGETLGRLDRFWGQAGEGLEGRPAPQAAPPVPAVPGPAVPAQAVLVQATPQGATPPGAAPHAAAPMQAAPLPGEVRQPAADPLQVIHKVLSSVWVPIETAGIVLVVLIFVLLEQEALRDRFIRIAGGSDIRLTTLAINDAGERLSRFFVLQFAVNLGVGLMVWLALSLVALPHALLWAVLAAVLRFVPYVGFWIAAACASLLAAAVEPGWSLFFLVLGLLVSVELIAGQLVEPQLYGHTTGLSPLSVVIAAIFWSWLWGPIGLIVSTPLTLCLLVAGRHIKALSLLDVLLGDTQALTMPQRLYQRALSADSQEIIAGAREFLKRNSFATYCDLVLMPALHLARLDLDAGAIDAQQQAKVRTTLVAVVAAIDGASRQKSPRRHRDSSVLAQTNAGRQLRQQRELTSGRWQGPLSVPPGSVMLCLGLGSMSDELATELLVRILRKQKIDARHLSLDDLSALPPPHTAEAVSMVYVVSAFPSEERERGEEVVSEMRRRLPNACIVAVYLPGMLLQPDLGSELAVQKVHGADKMADSLSQALQICIDMHEPVVAKAS